MAPFGSSSFFRRILAPLERSAPLSSFLGDLHSSRHPPIIPAGGSFPSGPIIHPAYSSPEPLVSVPITFVDEPPCPSDPIVPSPLSEQPIVSHDGISAHTGPAPVVVEPTAVPPLFDASGAGAVAHVSSLCPSLRSPSCEVPSTLLDTGQQALGSTLSEPSHLALVRFSTHLASITPVHSGVGWYSIWLHNRVSGVVEELRQPTQPSSPSAPVRSTA